MTRKTKTKTQTSKKKTKARAKPKAKAKPKKKAPAKKTTKNSGAGRVRKTTSAAGVFVHPQGLAESKAIGRGSRVWAFAHVMDGAIVGENCNVGECSFIESGAVLGDKVTIKNGVQVWDGVTCEDYVFVGPNATFTNDLTPRVEFPKTGADWVKTLVRRGASIGANATILCGTTIGPYAMVGAGCMVLRDVASHALVAGNPARRIGWACRCGETFKYGMKCEACGREYERDGDGLIPARGEKADEST